MSIIARDSSVVRRTVPNVAACSSSEFHLPGVAIETSSTYQVRLMLVSKTYPVWLLVVSKTYGVAIGSEFSFPRVATGIVCK